MAHRLVLDEESPKTQKKITMPSLTGKYGFAFLIRHKQLFVGIELDEVEIERVVRKRTTRTTKKKTTQVLRFDPSL